MILERKYFGYGALAAILAVGSASLVSKARTNEYIEPKRDYVISSDQNEIETAENIPEVNLATPEIENNYEGFDFPEEISMIKKHAARKGVDPELIMAIRMAENGGKGKEYGIIPYGAMKTRYVKDKGYQDNGQFVEYSGEVEKQLVWCVNTVANNQKRWKDSKSREDFISYLANIYCPIGASNDPNGLNKHWENNVNKFYEEFN